MKSKLLITLLITCSLCTNITVYAKGFHGGHSSHSHSHIGGKSSHSTHNISRPKISNPPSGSKAGFKSSTSKSITNSTNNPNISKPSNKSSNVVNKPPIINNINNNNINSQPSRKHSFFNNGWLWFLLGRSTSHRQPIQQTEHLKNGEVNENNSIQRDIENQDTHRKILRNLIGGGVISIVVILILRKLFK